jgi:competence protein CoiA
METDMKFALVNGVRREAQKGQVGECIGCSYPTISKCGEKRVHHWAHKSGKPCDHWWENETEWHRKWKNLFPEAWQEVIHRADTGEFHRADVKTDKSWVFEFQYSAISQEERSSRNAFYGKLVWIVNGLRRKKDPEQFFRSLKVVKTFEDSLFRRACDVTNDKSALLREWSNDKAPVFFDFSEPDALWCLLPRHVEGEFVVVEVLRQRFLDLHLMAQSKDVFGELIQVASAAVSADDLFLKFHYLRREEERCRQLMAEEAQRRNPYANHRARFRF